MSRAPKSALGPAAAALGLWTLAFCLAGRLTASETGPARAGERSLAERVLGSARVALGQELFTTADNYFHRGVKHTADGAFDGRLFQRWERDIRPNRHAHTEGQDVKEVLPWLRFTTEMDPHNVPAYLTTAYWLASAVERPDLAEKVLIEARENNPADYRVFAEWARLLMPRRDDARTAALLDRGIRLWPSGQDPADEQAAMDLSQMLTYRGFIYSLQHDREAAQDCFTRALAAMPSNGALAARVEALRQGQDLTEHDRALWLSLFGHPECAREDHEHDGHHDGD